MEYEFQNPKTVTNEEIRQAIRDNYDLIDSPTKIADKIIEKYGLPPEMKRSLTSRICTRRDSVKKEFTGKDTPGDGQDKTIREETQDTLNFQYDGTQSITSKEQAIKFFQIDLKEYEVERFITNSWDVTMKSKDGEPIKRTNYQVKLFLKKITDEEKEFRIALEEMLDYVKNQPKVKPKRVIGAKEALVAVADIHAGAKTTKEKGAIRTPDFSVEKIIEYLDQAANIINEKGYRKVHLAILGDLIESLTGLNHINSWFSMEEDVVFGNSIIVSYEIIKSFLSKINNLEEIYMVSGNHDRASDRNDHDVSGTAATLVAYMLKRDFKVTYHPFLLKVEIDNISYILTHGDSGMVKKGLGDIFYKYGNPNMYNVLLSGHLHSGNTRRPVVMNEDSLVKDLNYRHIIVQAIFTGNFWSEKIGFNNHAGLSILEATPKKDNINHYDIAL